MRAKIPTDYETYQEIMGELLQPIQADGLDVETIKRLYESKLVYLQNLRTKCFMEMNAAHPGFFSSADYDLILKAQAQTRQHLKDLILMAIRSSLSIRT